MKLFLIPIMLLLSAGLLRAQPLLPEELDRLSEEHARATLPELLEFLGLPNDAHIPEQLEPNIRWLEKAFSKRGFSVKRLPTPAIDLVLAEARRSAELPTVLVYVQVDGQPVDPDKWDQVNPFTPTLKKPAPEGRWETIDLKMLEGPIDPDWRVFARSASDAKGPINMFLAAWDAMAEAGRKPPFNVKVIMDCEEEISSPNLPAAVEQYRADLQADHLIILDGPPHITNRPTLVYGARGIADVTLTTYGPRVPQHSGHYGNYAPNPALRLAQLLASMKDVNGRVIIPGWYDGINIDEKTRQELKQVPDDLREINRKLGIGRADLVGGSLQEAIQYPSLNIRGMASAWVGQEARTIIPDKAVAEIDIRLVRESDPERLIQLLRTHIQNQGFQVLEGEPTEEQRLLYPRIASLQYHIAYAAFRTDMDSPTGQWLERALQRTFKEDPVKIRTHGGSIPISPFVQTLGVPAVIVPLVNPDNNQHSPNENLRLGNYFRGVKMCLGILTEPVQ